MRQNAFYEYVLSHGLRVTSCDGDFSLPHINAYGSPDTMPVALQTQTNQLLAHPATRQLIYEQMMEVIGAANALGVSALDESFAQKMMQMTDEMVPYSPSMRLDFDFHRPMEIHYLYTRPIAEARSAGFAMPRLEMLERELLFIDARNR